MASHDGGDGSIPPPSGLQFVNMTPTSQAERQRNRKVIRSAAMKTFRRNQKLEREGKPQAVLRSKSEAEDQELSYRLRLSSENEVGSSEARWPGSQTLSSKLVAGTSGNSAVAIPASNVNWASWSQTALRTPAIAASSPIEKLGAGRLDPFRTYPVDISGPHINEIMDHSVTVLWPGFRPASKGVRTKIASAWFEKATARPIVTHALLFGGSVHRDVLRSPRLSLDSPIRLFHKVQTMRLLKEALKTPSDVCMDDIILAVLVLCTNEVETFAVNMHKIPSPFNSPLTSVQWLDVYGRISFIPAHTVAMRSLVASRGGLERIELDGLAEVLSFSDILGATQGIHKPHFPFLDRWIREPDSSRPSAVPSLSQKRLGEGFRDFIDTGITERAASVFRATTNLAIEIDLHHRGVEPISDMTLFMDRRNAIQHRLMSLPTDEELASGEVSSPRMYESVRLAGIIFSAAVTFPMPPYQGIFRRLAGRLKTVLEESKLDKCWQLYPKTLLWVLILGGIAALNSEERSWYVRTLAVISQSLGILEWEDVVEEMVPYLWLDSACDTGGRMLWAAVAEER